MKPLQCQSCGMPVTREFLGTQRDGSTTEDYCINCFEFGEFTNLHLTLHELELNLMDMAKVHNEISLEEAQQIIRCLPKLKRWEMSSI